MKDLTKELTIEQKAKRYDEAIKIAKSKINNDKDHLLYEEDIIEIFPELKKKTDEEIRQQLIAVCHLYYGAGDDSERDECLEWLEKQSKNKPIERKEFTSIPFGAFDSELFEEMLTVPDGCVATIEGNKIHIKRKGKSAIEASKEEKIDNANKVEPKFKEGEYVIDIDCSKVLCISKILSKGYMFENGDYSSFDSANKEYRLWTIQDAQDGDVLVSSIDKPFIYNDCYNKYEVCAYCGLNINNEFTIAYERCYWTINENIRPATKEECKLLFDEMKRLGWTWNPETKELNRLNKNEENNN